MHRIDGPGATEDNRFTDGNPASGIPPTIVTDDWANAVQEEIVAVIAAAGLVLNKSYNGQLKDAIEALIAAVGVDQATTSAPGIVELATNAEAVAGVDAERAVTPAALAAALAGLAKGMALSTIMHVRDEKANGTSGGNTSAGTWHTRDLNQVKINNIAGASLASNRITLPAGTYFVLARAPIYGCEHSKSKIYNVTGAADLVLGSNARAGAGDTTMNSTWVMDVLTLAVTSNIELRTYAASAGTNGLGVATSAGTIEVYSGVIVWKLA